MKRAMNLMRTLSVVLIFIFVGQVLAVSAFADSEWNPFSENKKREQLVLEALENETPLPPENEDVTLPTTSSRWMCIECSWFMPSVCAAEAIVKNTYTHEYGIFTKGTCNVTELYSSAGYVCPTCHRVDLIEGQHWCWDCHTACGRGLVDMCPMEVS